MSADQWIADGPIPRPLDRTVEECCILSLHCQVGRHLRKLWQWFSLPEITHVQPEAATTDTKKIVIEYSKFKKSNIYKKYERLSLPKCSYSPCWKIDS